MVRRSTGLPRTAAWNQVTELLARGASAARIASATFAAASPKLGELDRDPVLGVVIVTLARVLRASSASDLAAALRDADPGAARRAEANPIALVAAVADALEARADAIGATDVGDLAQLAAVEALARLAPPSVPGSLARHEGEEAFVAIARGFFARFLERWTLAWLARELPNHLGEGLRFSTLGAHAQFREALVVELERAAASVDPFARSFHRSVDPIDAARAARFAHDALLAIEASVARAAAPSSPA
jgi:hypothetical protein